MQRSGQSQIFRTELIQRFKNKRLHLVIELFPDVSSPLDMGLVIINIGRGRTGEDGELWMLFAPPPRFVGGVINLNGPGDLLQLTQNSLLNGVAISVQLIGIIH